MTEAACVEPADTGWVSQQRRWASGWRRTVFPAVFLVYLAETAGAVAQYNGTAGEVAGFLVLAVFCASYVVALSRDTFTARAPTFWAIFAVQVACLAAELPLAHGAAFVMAVFIVVLAVGRLHARAAPVVVAFTAGAVLLPSAVPSWHQGPASGAAIGTAFAIPMVALAMFSFFNVLRGNVALAQARSEVSRLAAENERIRIARDLHDLLGHSLTTIIVKAELARRLTATDAGAAAAEIAEVEALTRASLADVRAAVSRYREPTVAGELATGRELLRAAGITADLPRSVDGLDERGRELFAWVLREGLTNVVRHSHAATCTVTLTADAVQIADDGTGGDLGATGSGLSGLRERVDAAGGTIEAGPSPSGGWRLRVALAPEHALR